MQARTSVAPQAALAYLQGKVFQRALRYVLGLCARVAAVRGWSAHRSMLRSFSSVSPSSCLQTVTRNIVRGLGDAR